MDFVLQNKLFYCQVRCYLEEFVTEIPSVNFGTCTCFFWELCDHNIGILKTLISYSFSILFAAIFHSIVLFQKPLSRYSYTFIFTPDIMASLKNTHIATLLCFYDKWLQLTPPLSGEWNTNAALTILAFNQGMKSIVINI